MARNRSRILIADDHTLVAELCKTLLDSEFDVVGIVSNGQELMRTARELKPDLIIVDVAMPVLNGLDAGQQVKAALPEVKLVYLTMNPDPELAAEAFRRGARGYLLKTCAASELVTAVRYVLRGNSYLSPTLSRDTVRYLRHQRDKIVEEEKRLTDRQREVLQLLAEGIFVRVSPVSQRSAFCRKTKCFNQPSLRVVVRSPSFAESPIGAIITQLQSCDVFIAGSGWGGTKTILGRKFTLRSSRQKPVTHTETYSRITTS